MDESKTKSNKCRECCSATYKDVVIIGNGPSAITLSYMLAGNWPYFDRDQAHPNEYLNSRLLEYDESKSILEMDLDYLSNGLQGRSVNPLSVLLDQLQHPEADFGVEAPSTLLWKFNQNKVIDHVVLGKGLPGGAWHKMDDCKETLTISLGSWMQLPGMGIKEWCNDYKRSESRVSLSCVANYYKDYVKCQNLSQYFRNHSTVTTVKFNKNTKLYEVCGKQNENQRFRYKTPNVVLATGNSDRPNKLNVPGEKLPFVIHSLNELEHLLSEGKLHPFSDPILIVGAGLSAADAVIAARFNSIPIVHVFRRHPDDSALIFNQLPENMYPEYHKVHSRMKKALPCNGYKPFSMHCVKEIKDNKEVVLSNIIGADDTQLITSVTVKVSYVLVLIGMKPELSFIKPKSLLTKLGIKSVEPIDTRSNPIRIDPISHESTLIPGLYAIGPLVGDNFVRFVQGGALAITKNIWENKT